MTRHRCDVKFSSDYELMEDVYITLGKSDSATGTVYKMLKKEQQLIDAFMTCRNQMNLMAKCNIDANGKALNVDPATGRVIPIGDGVVNQIERFADKYAYSKLTTNIFDTIMAAMRQKSKKSQGNQYVFIINELLWDDVQKNLRTFLKDWKTNGTVFFSQKKGGTVEIGATFETYNFAGNQLTFMVDKSLSLEFPERPYGLCLDLTADLVGGRPAIQNFALKGKTLVKNVVKGVGSEETNVASLVAASTIVYTGYSSVCVFAPYRSYVIEKNISII